VPSLHPALTALAAVGLCIGLVTLAGCGSAPPVGLADDVPVDDVGAAALAVGDCADAEHGSILAGIRLTDCTAGHDWEVYFQFAIDAVGFPGEAALVAAAEEACASEFPVFLGLGAKSATGAAASATVGALGYTYLLPLEAEWGSTQDHRVSCLIGDMNGQVTGSLGGAGGTAGSTATG
jgi:hypothetical protein